MHSSYNESEWEAYKKVNEKLTIGGRLKLLSGSLGLETSSNNGNYYITHGGLLSDPYQHNYENLAVLLNTSGLLDSFDLSDDIGSPSELMAGLFFMNGSMGAAVDLGFTYKASDELIFTGS